MHLANYWRALVCASLVGVLGATCAAAATPVVTNIQPPPDGFYGSNRNSRFITIAVAFSDNVTVTGSPTLAVRIGSSTRLFTNGSPQGGLGALCIVRLHGAV